MNTFAKVVAALCVPMSLIMLITGFSFITKNKQVLLEEKTEQEIQEDFTPVIRFAVTSDVHVNENDPGRADRLGKMFQTMYAYADAHPTYNTVDAVVVVGDLTDDGSDIQYDIFNSIVNENIRPETTLIPVMGNHEFGVGGHEGFERNMNSPLLIHTTVKGFHFIGMAPDPSDTWHSPSQLLWMSKQLREAAAEDGEKPIFTMQHGHIWNTVYVSRSWYTQMSIPLHMVFSRYPQIVNFSGHSHGPINNPLTVWQNSYTTIGTGTMKYFEMERDITKSTVPAGAENAAQYHIVEVDANNRVRVLPFNILTGDFFRTPATTDDPDKQLIFQIDKPSDPSTYVYTSARKSLAGVPWFREGAKIQVSGITKESASFTFDRADDDVCVYGYRIRISATKNPNIKVAEANVYSEYYFEPVPETQSCTIDGLAPGTEYIVSVTPLNVWQQAGEPITAYFKTAQ